MTLLYVFAIGLGKSSGFLFVALQCVMFSRFTFNINKEKYKPLAC